jgi:hypothetical protein
MNFRIAVATAAVCLLAAPALADNTCVEPFAPTVPHGGNATKEQMLTARKEVTDFIKLSDQYQQCIILDVQQQRTAAQHDGKTVPQDVEDRAKARIDDNQRDKERVGKEFNDSVHAYDVAHPSPQSASPVPAPAPSPSP